MSDTDDCPECGEPTVADYVDIGVGEQRMPASCPCGYAEPSGLDAFLDDDFDEVWDD